MKQVFLYGPLDRMKKNVLPDYPTDDVPIAFYFQMKNTLDHTGDRTPSGLSVTSRAEMETSMSFLDLGKNLPMLHEAIKTGVCHPHSLLLQTVSAHRHGLENCFRCGSVQEQTNALARHAFVATGILTGEPGLPLESCHFLYHQRGISDPEIL